MRYCCGSHHDVPSTDKLQPRLEDGDVHDVNEVTQVIGQKPVVNVLWSLAGKGPADWDEPHVPVPRQAYQHHPQHVHQVLGKNNKHVRGAKLGWEVKRYQIEIVGLTPRHCLGSHSQFFERDWTLSYSGVAPSERVVS